MGIHYSQPKGFVGRNIAHAILYNGVYYGHILGGSATLHLPGRDEFFDITLFSSKGETKEEKVQRRRQRIDDLNHIVNNIFYHIRKVDGKYPKRNFTTFVIKGWVEQMKIDWLAKYSDEVVGFESLVELPRSGELYRRAGWSEVGETKGYTCKREAGKGSDEWSGRRVWCKDKLRPKKVFVLKV